MAKGLLAKATPAANTDVVVYSFPSTIQFATASIKLVNTSASDINVRVAGSTNTTPGNTDYLLYDVPVPANGVLDVACELFSPSEKIIVRGSASGLTVRVTGLEQD